MKLSDFQFDLPKTLLAQRPSPDRDESRLMVLNRKEEKIEHHVFKDIINYFDEGDVIVGGELAFNLNLKVNDNSHFDEFDAESKREMSTTMVFVRLITSLLRDKKIGKRW